MLKERSIGKVRGAILIGIALVMGANLIQPAVAHLTTFAHLKDHFQTKTGAAINADDIDDFTAPDFTSILSKKFTAPRNGVLFIVGSVGAEDDCSLPGGGWLSTRLRVGSTPVYAKDYAHELSSDCSTNIGAASATMTAAVKVSKGTHTVHIDAVEFGNGSYITARELSIAFFSKGSGISVPASKAVAGGGQSPNRSG